MLKVERHFTTGSPEMVRLCGLSRELYNRCNYLSRKAWFSAAGKRAVMPSLSELAQFAAGLECYRAFGNTKTAKQTIRMVLSDWSTYFKMLKAFKVNPSAFLRPPKPPGYKKKMTQVVFYNETIKGGESIKPRDRLEANNGLFSVRRRDGWKQVVVTPKSFGFIVEVRYDEQEERKDKEKAKVHRERFCAVDLGVNNLATIASDQHCPILVNGRIVKSFNQWFNKRPCKSRLRKRYFRMENYFHHVSRLIVDNCVRHGIGTIVVGRSKGWKQDGGMGHGNQRFQHIPFERLQQKIQYKAAQEGIEVMFAEEAYTSKASYLDRDPIPAYGRGDPEPVMTGSRVKRGLYRTKSGVLLNADANGACNIARKVIQDEDALLRLDRSLAARPVRVNPLRKSDGEGLTGCSLNVGIV